MRVSAQIVEKFWARVDVCEGVGCWEWKGSRSKAGYGYFHLHTGRKRVLAHRFAYELEHGPLLERQHALHHCDNPPCVRVGDGHVFAGTHLDNMHDRDAKGRGRGFAHTNQSHCLRGHPLAHPNLYITKTGKQVGKRRCRACTLLYLKLRHVRRMRAVA